MNVQDIKAILIPFVATWGVRVIGVLVALFAGWMFAAWVRATVASRLEARGLDKSLSRFLANILRWALIACAVIGCLGVFGVETTSFAAVLASGGIAIGLAFQGTLSNFAAGVMLVFFRPFTVGDVVKVAGATGAVEEIDLFTTSLKTFDNRRVIIPNTSVFGAVIENLSFYEERRVDISVGVAYDADIEQTRAVLTEVAGGIGEVLSEPAPQVFLSALGDSAVAWQVRLWCRTDDYWRVHETATRDVKAALDAHGLNIPFPQMDVHLMNAAPVTDTAA
jgi:small conductance mechanosensitive channel